MKKLIFVLSIFIILLSCQDDVEIDTPPCSTECPNGTIIECECIEKMTKEDSITVAKMDTMAVAKKDTMTAIIDSILLVHRELDFIDFTGSVTRSNLTANKINVSGGRIANIKYDSSYSTDSDSLLIITPLDLGLIITEATQNQELAVKNEEGEILFDISISVADEIEVKFQKFELQLDTIRISNNGFITVIPSNNIDRVGGRLNEREIRNALFIPTTEIVIFNIPGLGNTEFNINGSVNKLDVFIYENNLPTYSVNIEFIGGALSIQTIEYIEVPHIRRDTIYITEAQDVDFRFNPDVDSLYVFFDNEFAFLVNPRVNYITKEHKTEDIYLKYTVNHNILSVNEFSRRTLTETIRMVGSGTDITSNATELILIGLRGDTVATVLNKEITVHTYDYGDIRLLNDNPLSFTYIVIFSHCYSTPGEEQLTFHFRTSDGRDWFNDFIDYRAIWGTDIPFLHGSRELYILEEEVPNFINTDFFSHYTDSHVNRNDPANIRLYLIKPTNPNKAKSTNITFDWKKDGSDVDTATVVYACGPHPTDGHEYVFTESVLINGVEVWNRENPTNLHGEGLNAHPIYIPYERDNPFID